MNFNNQEQNKVYQQDDRLQVRFFRMAYESFDDETAKVNIKDIDAIEIRVPGSSDVIVRQVQHDQQYSDIARFPRQWEAYQEGLKSGVRNDLGGKDVVGTPVEDILDDMRMVYSLKAANIFSVEQLASMSDGQVQAFGMGIGTIREKARRVLDERRVAENEELKAKLDKVLAKVQGEEKKVAKDVAA